MRRTLSSIIGFSLVAGTVVLAAPPAHAANGDIVLVSGRPDGNLAGLFEVWRMDASGAEQENVTRAPASVDVDPSWEPDANRIVFARQRPADETFDLLIKDLSDTGTTSITSGSPSDRQPDWGPTGQIVFTRSIRSEGSSTIYRIGDGGGGLTQLTTTPAPGYDSSPAWSPLGGEIAFVSDRAGGIPQIFTMLADGTGQTQRTFDPCFAGNPSWLGDTMIVFDRQCPGADSDIYTLDLTTNAATELFDSSSSDHQPAASPMGDQVAFTRIEAGTGDKNVYLTSVVAASPTPIPDNSGGADMAADWGSGVFRPFAAPEATGPEATVPALPRLEGRASSEQEEVRAPKGKKKKKGKKRRKNFRVSPGVKFKRFRKARSDAYLLRVNPPSRATMDVALAQDRLPGRERVKGMAKRHGAVAAINGDFGMPPNGRPSHTFAKDGDLKQVSFAVAWNFAMARDEQQTFIDRPAETVTAVETDTWRVERWNFGTPAFNDIAAFTSAAGSAEQPPANACAVRLTPTAGPRFASGSPGVETPYEVSAIGCSTSPMATNGGIVLAARPGSDGAILLQSLMVGETVEITWSLGWDQVVDTLGGTPLLVENGSVDVKKCNGSICGKHPRTAIGVTSAGRILMLVIDGRSQRSKGVTMKKLAKIMQGLGAVFALNLDGGGSSTMVVRGKVMNRPSDGNQRRVSSSVLVLDGPDANESIGAPVPRTVAPGAGLGLAPREGEAALLDPASTGGLLEALAEGTFGPRVDLPPVLDRALRRFERGA